MDTSTREAMRTEVHAVINTMGGASRPRIAHRVAHRVAAMGSVNELAVSRTLAVEEVADAVQGSFE